MTISRTNRSTTREDHPENIVDFAAISSMLERAAGTDPARAKEIIHKAAAAKGLNLQDVAHLLTVTDPEVQNGLFETARRVKNTIYGRRVVVFAPLYVSNICVNDCAYCAFRSKNPHPRRTSLSNQEVEEEVRALLSEGQKRLLLVAGESNSEQAIDRLFQCIDVVYATRRGKENIRRVNVNFAPMSIDDFRRLAEHSIGTYQSFQETYHRETYVSVHPSGPKADYDWRLGTMDRALSAGLKDVGIGALFGLFDWRFELLALLQHARHLEESFGVGPHTISVPRLEPAFCAPLSRDPACPVSDQDLRRVVAILRLAVPYTGIILSTREKPELRRELLALGVSQISAGSCTSPGGYSSRRNRELAQFSLGDHRPLDEVVRDLAIHGYIPSFCTACYRMGRVGKDFMDLAKPGAIRRHCDPNAMLTFQEYLLDHASEKTRETGDQALSAHLGAMDHKRAKLTRQLLTKVCQGHRDVLV